MLVGQTERIVLIIDFSSYRRAWAGHILFVNALKSLRGEEVRGLSICIAVLEGVVKWASIALKEVKGKVECIVAI